MGILTRRDRTVSFRLSEKEYHSLFDFCRAAGVRSISDFARAAVCKAMASQPAGGDDLASLISQMNTLHREHSELSRRLAELSGRINGRDQRP